MNKNIQIIRLDELSKLLCISKPTLWRWRRDSSIGFPFPILLGSRLVGWRLIEIEKWLDSNQCKRYAA
jgi:predicted DNA-binding transcriptional regulator AlpA